VYVDHLDKLFLKDEVIQFRINEDGSSTVINYIL
jgi:hypothetical protein